METLSTIPTNTVTARKRIIRSHCLVKYIKSIQQANERTAAEYEYRLSRFEKYATIIVGGCCYIRMEIMFNNLSKESQRDERVETTTPLKCT